MTDQIKALSDLILSVASDYQQIKQELTEIKKLLQYPSYMVPVDKPDLEAWKELRTALNGPKKPGQIIPLSRDAFNLYQELISCPPQRR